MKVYNTHFRGSVERKSQDKLVVYESHMGSKHNAISDAGYPKKGTALYHKILATVAILLFVTVLYLISSIPGPELWEETGLKKYTGKHTTYVLLFIIIVKGKSADTTMSILHTTTKVWSLITSR